MNIILKKAMLVSVLVCSMMLFAFGGCGLEREYYDDIIISLEFVVSWRLCFLGYLGLFSATVEPITEYTDSEVVNFVNGEWDWFKFNFEFVSVPHTDKYINGLKKLIRLLR